MDKSTAPDTTDTRLAVFELRVTVRVPLEVFSHALNLTAEANAVTREAKRDIEQGVIHCLRRLEWESDVECMGVAIKEE